MLSVALLMTLTSGAAAPDYYPCYSYGGSYSYGSCYSYGGSYSYGSCYSYGGCYPTYSYGGSYSYGGCYPTYSYGGCYPAYSSMSYGKAPDETQEEFDFCQEKAKEMAPDTYTNFRNSVWLRMTHEQRQKMMQKGGKGKKQDEESASTLLPAQIVVTLPADARLTIADEGTKSAGPRRAFDSPPLQRNRSYSYTVKAEFVRDGKTVSVSKDVAVSAGKVSRVSFDDVSEQNVANR